MNLIGDKDAYARYNNQAKDEQNANCCQKFESSSYEQTLKFRMELKKKEDEIMNLKKLLMEARQVNIQHQQNSSTEENYNDDETMKDPNDEGALGKNQDVLRIRPYQKEIIFNGKKGNSPNSDLEKPSNDEIIQMHYRMEVLQYTKSTLQSKIELGSLKNTLTKVIMVEDSRKRSRNNYKNDHDDHKHPNDSNGHPFQFILGQDQVTLQWEHIVREMYRGEVAMIEMKFDSLDELDVLSLFPNPLSLMKSSNEEGGEEKEQNEVEIIGYGVKCRIELIDFWKYQKPFRPLIMTI